MLDVSRAVVVTPPARTGPGRKAVELLVEEDRGANLDTLDVPLNDRLWLRDQFARLKSLDAEADRIVVYAGDSFRNLIRLDADEHPVHEWFKKPDPPVPVEFDIPEQATADGTLTLTWRQKPGKGANGRGCQVAEVWLIRK